jgi:electron transport complex protein RnfC
MPMGLLDLIIPRRTFSHGGIHPAEHKELTAALPIRRLPFAPELAVLLSQHRGAPAVPVVKVGQEVVRGEPIARAAGFVSVPMHAPATGVVKAIAPWATAEGPKAEAIVLEVYEAAPQQVLYDAVVDVEALTPDEIVMAVQEAGLVGLGGAAFPSHVKMKPPKGKRVEIVVVNGCECEPYLTCDHRIMLEKTDALLRGIRIAMKATGVSRAMIGVEDNKLDAVAAIQAKLPADGGITVHAIETKYPQGAEKMLIESLLDRQVPPGGLPADVGVAVFNVGTLAQIGELLPRGRGLIERVVTVSGPGVQRPGNYLVPIGTPLRFLLDHVGAKPGANEVILGGPMMGMSVASVDVPITKAVSGIVVYERGDADQTHRFVFPCIKCARCVEACPMHLNPSMLGELARKRQYETMEQKYNLNDCFECGCCAYVCPSNIPLTQYFRIAKAIRREQKIAAAEENK